MKHFFSDRRILNRLEKCWQEDTHRWIVTTLALFLATGAWFVGIGRPLYRRVHTYKALAENQEQLHTQQKALEQQISLLRHHIEYRSTYKERFKDHQDHSLIEEGAALLQALQTHHLHLISYQPAETPENTTFHKKKATIICQGSYPDLQRFITWLHNTYLTIQACVTSLSIMNATTLQAAIDISILSSPTKDESNA